MKRAPESDCDRILKPTLQVTGKAVLVWRGECSFIEKAAAAQAAGAAAVIVVSDEAELSPMSCAGNTSITIPVMQVLTEVGPGRQCLSRHLRNLDPRFLV